MYVLVEHALKSSASLCEYLRSSVEAFYQVLERACRDLLPFTRALVRSAPMSGDEVWLTGMGLWPVLHL